MHTIFHLHMGYRWKNHKKTVTEDGVTRWSRVRSTSHRIPFCSFWIQYHVYYLFKNNTISENPQWRKTWRILTCPSRRPCQLLPRVARSPANRASSPLAAVSSVEALSVNWKNGSLGDPEGSRQGDWTRTVSQGCPRAGRAWPPSVHRAPGPWCGHLGLGPAASPCHRLCLLRRPSQPRWPGSALWCFCSKCSRDSCCDPLLKLSQPGRGRLN